MSNNIQDVSEENTDLPNRSAVAYYQDGATQKRSQKSSPLSWYQRLVR